MGLAAVQMFPSVEWIANVHRSLNTAWPPLPLHAILSFVSRDIIRATNTSGFDIPEQAAYMGTILFLAPLAALHFRKESRISGCRCLECFRLFMDSDLCSLC
jgi:hypothetical protein